MPFLVEQDSSIPPEKLCGIVSSWQKSDWYCNCIITDNVMRNKTPILKKTRAYINSSGNLERNRTKANNRINTGIYPNIVSQKATFLCGQPITFSSEDKRLEELLNTIGASGFNLDMMSIADTIIGYGCCMTLTYIDGATGAPTLKVINPTQFIPFFREDSPRNCSSFIHFYKKTAISDNGTISTISCIDYYYDDKKRSLEYNIAPCGFEIIRDIQVGLFSYESVVGRQKTTLESSRNLYQLWRSDDDCQPLLTKIKSALDAYNTIISSGADRCYDQAGDIIIITGVSSANMKNAAKIYEALHENGIALLGCNGTTEKQSADVVRHAFESSSYIPMMSALHTSIFSNATCVDIQRDSLQNTSGAAIRFKYEPMYFDALRTKTYIEGNIRRYIDFILKNRLYINLTDAIGNPFDDINVNAVFEIIFNFDLPANEAEIVNSIVAARSAGIITAEEARDNIPWQHPLYNSKENIEQLTETDNGSKQ